ncbi:MAG: alcohol dehydrogenase catalytic domain-containing protein [Acidimicrobiales bacterium]
MSPPVCGPDDVLVAMKACGVCGTDVTYVYLGGLPVEGGRCPMPLGHEPAGEIVEIGVNVTAIPIGMRVVFNPNFDEIQSIGNGGEQGSLSDLVAVRNAVLGENIFSIPDEVPYEIAALTEPLSVALHAVNRAAPEPGQTAVVFGAGPVGVAIVAWLKIRGVRDVVSVDLSEARLSLASTMGADAQVVATENVVDVLRERHGTAFVLGAPVAATDIWIDAAGAQQVIDTILYGSRMHATAVIVAVHKQPVQMDMVTFLTKELRFTSSLAYPTEFGDAANEISENWSRFAPMVTNRMSFEEAKDAIALAGSTEAVGKVTVVF